MSGYRINEIFNSIQGEGSRAGTHCVFVRFQGCNLNCKYCDTPEAIKHNLDDKGITKEELLKKLTDKIPNIVLTGGEPLMQIDDELLGELTKIYNHITIQTNGSIKINPYVEATLYRVPHLVCCDIKNIFDTENVLRTINNIGENLTVEYKIPVKSPAEALEADKIVGLLKDFQPKFDSEFLVSPVVKPTQAIDKLYADYVKLADYQHTRLNMQIHKLIGVK